MISLLFSGLHCLAISQIFHFPLVRNHTETITGEFTHKNNNKNYAKQEYVCKVPLQFKEFNRESSSNPVVGLFSRLLPDFLSREEAFEAIDLNKVPLQFFIKVLL
ncbi:unnamed protein product [Cuscuta epithymum]|uniref:Uncharacterized protein n=1 Tax=Cuscuta epithymum TaxID=186058 RepID=A0AAV0CL34_9ASTE|nr:unnamed protein product [Cuscuta epithymum]CAH9079945.1 unnamed protein product [Cuscuta epithymum]